jgi:vacuolar-type H+-ATPase subunit I/STV1
MSIGKFILIAGSAIFLSSFIEAGTGEKINEDIKRIARLLEEEKTEHQREKEQVSSAHKSLEERIKVLEEKIGNLKNDTRELKNKISSVKKEESKLGKDKKASEIFLAKEKKVLVEDIEKIEERIKFGFPFEIDLQLNRMDNLKRSLQQKESDLLEVMQEIYIQLVREVELGENSEIYAEERETMEGEIKKAKIVRVGRVMLFYQTNDGKETGYLLKNKEGYVWKNDLRRKCRTNIKKAIETMKGKRIPELIEFPVIVDSIIRTEGIK